MASIEYRNKKYGGSFIDVLKDPIGTFKEALQPIPTRLNNISKKTLEQYGDEPIQKIQIARTPLSNLLLTGVNLISLNTFDDLRKKYGFDNLYHLSMIAYLPNTNIIIEKNETVVIEPLSTSTSLNDKTEYFDVEIPRGLTLNTMINNTINDLGSSKFYSYSAFNNNCQVFIEAILDSNNISSQRAHDFLFQDLSGIRNELNNSEYSYVPKVVNKITDLASTFSRLIGKGLVRKKHHSIIEKFLRNTLDNGLKFL